MKAIVENYRTDAIFDKDIISLNLEKIPIIRTTYFLSETQGIIEYKERVK